MHLFQPLIRAWTINKSSPGCPRHLCKRRDAALGATTTPEPVGVRIALHNKLRKAAKINEVDSSIPSDRHRQGGYPT